MERNNTQLAINFLALTYPTQNMSELTNNEILTYYQRTTISACKLIRLLDGLRNLLLQRTDNHVKESIVNFQLNLQNPTDILISSGVMITTIIGNNDENDMID